MDQLFDHNYSRNGLLFPDCSGVAAERKEWRLSCGFRRSGQPDSIRPARRGIGAFPGDDLVRNHFYGYLDHAFNFCGAAHWTNIRAFWSEADTDKVAGGNSAAVRTAYGPAESGADTEINLLVKRRASSPGHHVAGRARCRSLFCSVAHPESWLQERILFPFLSDGRARAVPGNHKSVIGQGQNAVVQGAHDFLERSSREIGASDAAGEQGITGDQ